MASRSSPDMMYFMTMHVRLWLVAIICCVGGAFASGQSRPSEELVLPTDPEVLKQYRIQTQFLLKLKLSSKYHTISDLLQTRIEDGAIILSTNADGEAQPTRMELDDMPGLTQFTRSRAGAGFVQLLNICPNANGYTVLSISGSAGSFSVHENEIATTTQTTTSFSQNLNRGSNPGMVSFSRVRSDRTNGSMREQKVSHASNLEELRRKNPAIEDDLRRLLGRFSQEHLLAADPKLAWQVFAQDAQPRPEMVAQVADLVKQLDDDASKVRDEAVVKLKNLGAPGMLAMVRVDRKGLSLEQQFRLDSAIEPYSSLPADLLKDRRNDTMFLLDCLICQDPAIGPLALARLKEVTGKTIEFKTDAPMDERIKAVGVIRRTLASPATRSAN